MEQLTTKIFEKHDHTKSSAEVLFFSVQKSIYYNKYSTHNYYVTCKIFHKFDRIWRDVIFTSENFQCLQQRGSMYFILSLYVVKLAQNQCYMLNE